MVRLRNVGYQRHHQVQVILAAAEDGGFLAVDQVELDHLAAVEHAHASVVGHEREPLAREGRWHRIEVGVEVSDVATVWSVFGMAMSGVLIRFGFRWLAVIMIVVVIMVVIMACSRFVF